MSGIRGKGHVWRSKPGPTANPRPEGGSLDSLLGYVCPIVWECETCGTRDVRTVCEEVVVDWVHAL